MKYGYFDDIKREYIITTPKTPLPWKKFPPTLQDTKKCRYILS